jgi:hypothetical protein
MKYLREFLDRQQARPTETNTYSGAPGKPRQPDACIAPPMHEEPAPEKEDTYSGAPGKPRQLPETAPEAGFLGFHGGPAKTV